MSEINNKELIERVTKLADKVKDAIDGEHTVVCMSALAYETAMMLVSHTDTQIATVEVGAKLFYEQILRNIKAIEQNITKNEKKNKE